MFPRCGYTYVHATRRERLTKHACAVRTVNGHVESTDLIRWAASLNYISLILVCLPAKNDGLHKKGGVIPTAISSTCQQYMILSTNVQ